MLLGESNNVMHIKYLAQYLVHRNTQYMVSTIPMMDCSFIISEYAIANSTPKEKNLSHLFIVFFRHSVKTGLCPVSQGVSQAGSTSC